MSDGRIVREGLDFESDFTRMPNDWHRDGQLSLKARGLLGLLMSHDKGYTVTVRSLVATNPEGRDAIDGAVRELRENDYLEMRKLRDRHGKITGTEWVLTDPAKVKKRRSELQPLFPTYGVTHIRENQHTAEPPLKKNNQKN